jgi:hypothetical protein
VITIEPNLATKEGWNRLAEAKQRTEPEAQTAEEIKKLKGASRREYNEARALWHANLGPFRTPQLEKVHEALWELVDSNQQDASKVKGSAAVDAYGGLGKTTAVTAFAQQLHRREIERYGTRTSTGDQHLPVLRVGLTSNTTMRGLNEAILGFYGSPPQGRNASQLAAGAIECVTNCATKLVFIDDIHFLNMKRRDGIDVSNHLKWLANEFPATFVFAGIGLQQRGLFSEGLAGNGMELPELSQTGRRCTRLTLRQFSIDNDPGRHEWRKLLLVVEKRLVLANKRPGDVADELAQYLFERSTGHIGSLMSLITRGTYRAISKGEERLTIDLLNNVKIDEAAELARIELMSMMNRGKLVATPKRRIRKRVKTIPAQSDSAALEQVPVESK